MATNIFTEAPLSATGVKPGQWFLDSSEDFNTIVAPGFLDTVANASVDLQPNDVVFAQYNEGQQFGLFVVVVSGETKSLQVYSPNDNSFVFDQVQFVAKGGSDLNPGNSIGTPKLTIGAALTALNLTPSQSGVVWVHDDGQYNEDLVLPFNVCIYAPNAELTCDSGDLLTVNDTGQATIASVTAKNINCSTGNVVNLLGTLSSLLIEANTAIGDMNTEGTLTLDLVTLADCEITAAAQSNVSLDVKGSQNVTVTADPAAAVGGNLGVLVSPGVGYVNMYGEHRFLDKLLFQVEPILESSGRSIVASDNNSRIVFSNASIETFTLEQTSTEDMPLGSRVEFTQIGAGQVNLLPGAGASIISLFGNGAATTGMGATAVAYKYTDTVWLVSGDLQAGP